MSFSYLTPPQSSQDSLPFGDDSRSNPAISVASTFYPGATFLHPAVQDVPADLIIHTSDSIFFYVHKSLILSRSSNYFNAHLLPEFSKPASSPFAVPYPLPTRSPLVNLLDMVAPPTPSEDPTESSYSSPTARARSIPLELDFCHGQGQPPDPPSTIPQLIAIPETAPLLNVVLHLLYNISCKRYSPDLDTLSALFPFMTKYGFSHHDLIPPSSEITEILLSHAVEFPLQVYTIAASNKLEDLCVAVSPSTLTVPLSQLTDGQALLMGPVYLKRLFFLHMGRAEALRRILLNPPSQHPPTDTCDLGDQKAVLRAWSLVTAYLLSSDCPQNMSTGMLASSFGPLANSVSCGGCKEMMQDRMRSLINSWSLVKSTI